jgi:hypothetical protein
VKSWFKKFRSGSRTENDLGEKPAVAGAESFAATYTTTEPIRSGEEEDKPTSDSIRDVALAGRKSDVETDDMYGGSSVPEGGVSPIHDGAETETGPGPAVDESTHRPVSPMSDSSELSEDPYVMAADVASSRYSAEHAGSKRDSGVDQAAALSDSDSEPRGRKGFRERFLKKVIPGRDKDKHKSTTETSAPIAEEASQAPLPDDTEPKADPDPQVLAETEPLREKIQEPSTTSTEVANTTETGATTPALTHTQTNGDDDDDFEEARDTFDEQRLGPPPKLVDMSGAKTETPRMVDVASPTTTKKASESPVGRNSTGGGSRFTEEL